MVFYYFFFKAGTEQWMLNLSALNAEELIHEEGQTLIQQKLDAWLAEQDSRNGKTPESRHVLITLFIVIEESLRTISKLALQNEKK